MAEPVRRPAKAAFAILAAAAVAAAGLWIVNDDSSSEPYTLPAMAIVTDGYEDVVSKEYYLDCRISVSDCDPEYELSGEDAEIKGRGNTTWYGNDNHWYDTKKKPFKIKFSDPVDLFGSGPAREWTLIANYTDQSLSRDYFAYNTALLLGMYASSTQFVNLWLNGVYEGVYLVCDQIELGEGRVQALDPLGNPYVCQYLLELNGWVLTDYSEGAAEGRDYFVADDQPYEFSDPHGSDLENGVFGTVEELFGRVLSMLRAGPDEYRFSEIQSVLDTESFAKTYIVNEIFAVQDINWSSFKFLVYGNECAADKLKISSGPVWDFDTSSGNTRNEHSKDPDNLWAAETNAWYHYLLDYDEFRTQVADILEADAGAVRELWASLYSEEMSHSSDFERNFDRWPVLGSSIWSNPLEFIQLRTWESHMDYLADWLYRSLDYVVSYYSEYAGRIYR
ncbi:hypothetical protein AUQ37_06340 [Candidatus Methanomethylophilus sp. 1R26]|uniref:CotH kinase family protein n=1 Tax=Candidatus Methanomethylophilus sp. 1R26 TaxID=1769296 RepID=UPI0007377238|nr:CotH kinase family protein [Candidatus Methanomethylophilus sp. 1R26]KUE74076.1 hypothetical protein AUQ37_06340 [Candidatus Methanomethylophilus sp. 1R26]